MVLWQLEAKIRVNISEDYLRNAGSQYMFETGQKLCAGVVEDIGDVLVVP